MEFLKIKVMSLGGSIQMHTREPQYVHPEQ